jgi:uncharacterized protein YutE (UPF0331/DUF86 family)
MTTIELEQQKIDELAAQYRREGYAVRLHPAGPELPEFLRPFEPDLIATSPRDNVVVAVKPSAAMNADEITRLAKAVEQQSGWRLDVVFVSQPVAAEIPAEEQLAPDAQVSRLLSSAEALFTKGEIEAAAMLAWSAVETILRRSAQSAAPEMERQSSARLLKHLYSLGRIEHTTYEKLFLLMQFRNAVAHGFEPRTAAPSIPDVVPDIRRLQREA